MNNKKTDDEEDINFYDAQSNVGDEYYIFTIDNPGGGSGVSCYFGFSTARQLLNCFKNHADFWNWSDGSEIASEEIASIIDSHANPESLESDLEFALDKYMQENAGVHLYSWGKFEDLCSSEDHFCAEVRTEFRESVNSWDDDENDENTDDEKDQSRPIEAGELDSFIDYLMRMPT